MMPLLRILAVVLLVFTAPSVQAMHNVAIERGGKTVHVSGKIVVKSQDGGMLVLDQAGKLWVIQPDEVVKLTRDDIEFEPHSVDQMSAAVGCCWLQL